ncbi:MAG TPA: hypothetical protein VME41_12315 [Stellaceae bacterium]|nr:hypothetical protein [Stellaceae bacterium]
MSTKLGALTLAAALLAGTSGLALAQTYYGSTPYYGSSQYYGYSSTQYTCPAYGYMGCCWTRDPSLTGFGSDNLGHAPIPQMAAGTNYNWAYNTSQWRQPGSYAYGTYSPYYAYGTYSPYNGFGSGSSYSPYNSYGYNSWGWGY